MDFLLKYLYYIDMKKIIILCKKFIAVGIIFFIIGVFSACDDNMCYVCFGFGNCYKCYGKTKIDGESCIVCKDTEICVNCNGAGRVRAYKY